MQMANANSSVAKKTRIPPTAYAAKLYSTSIRTVIVSDIKNPMRAAKIFGAFLISFLFRFNAFAIRRLKKLMGLYFAFVNALK